MILSNKLSIIVSWIEGTDAPGQAIKEERTTTTEEGGTTVVYNQNVSLSIEQQRQKFPVFKVLTW